MEKFALFSSFSTKIFVEINSMNLQIAESDALNSLPPYKQQYNLLHNPSSPFRTASVQQKQWRPLLQQAASAGEVTSNCYMEVTPLSPKGLPRGNDDVDEDEGVVDDDDYRMDLNMEGGEAEEEEDWIEVSNKGNQTPNHWVYSDMIRYSPSRTGLRIPYQCDSAILSSCVFQCRECRGSVESTDPGGSEHTRPRPKAPRRHPAVGHVLPGQVFLQQRSLPVTVDPLVRRWVSTGGSRWRPPLRLRRPRGKLGQILERGHWEGRRLLSLRQGHLGVLGQRHGRLDRHRVFGRQQPSFTQVPLRFLFSTWALSELSFVNRSNSRNRHPVPPPPYQQHLYQNTSSITNSPTAYSPYRGGAQKHQYSLQHSAPTAAALPVVFHNSTATATSSSSAVVATAAAVTKESNPEFFAVIKRNPDSGGGGGPLPRPPSDHFYFKITDGKTEFI